MFITGSGNKDVGSLHLPSADVKGSEEWFYDSDFSHQTEAFLILKQARISFSNVLLQLSLPWEDQNGFGCVFALFHNPKMARCQKAYRWGSAQEQCCCGEKEWGGRQLQAETQGLACVSPVWRNGSVSCSRQTGLCWTSRRNLIVKFLRNSEIGNSCSYLLCFSLFGFSQ